MGRISLSCSHIFHGFSLLFNSIFNRLSLIVYSIILLWSEDKISSPVRYSYLPILPDDNGDIFYASLLIYLQSYYQLISFYILSNRLFLKGKELSDRRKASVTKKESRFSVHFYTSWMIKWDFLIWNFHIIKCMQFSLTSFCTVE